MGSFAVTDRKSIIKSLIFLNIPAFIFLVSDFIHEKIIGAYTGVIGTITRYFFMPNMFLGTERAEIFRYNVCAVAGTEFVKDALYGDIVSVVILILFFIFGARAGKKTKY
jgi:hypothetical protein